MSPLPIRLSGALPLAFLAALTHLTSAPSCARQPGEADKKISPEAVEVLDRLEKHYAALNAVGVTATLRFSMTFTDGENHVSEQGRTIIIQRPNRAAVRAGNSGMGSVEIVCDGTTLWHYVGPPLNKYSQSPAPASVDELADAASLGTAPHLWSQLMNPDSVVLVLLDPGRLQSLRDSATSIEYLGREESGGITRDRIRVSLDERDFDLLVRRGDAAWADSLTPNLSPMLAGLGDMAESFKDRVPTMELLLTDWTSTPDIGPQTFAFTPPEDTEQVASLLDAMMEEFRSGAGFGDENHNDLLGQPAPPITADLLDGGKLDLAAHKGNNIVVLDFWATWCPPCVRGLPVVAGVTDSFRDKGVVFYAVNQGETADAIRKFLDKRSLNITVPLDPDGEAGRAFGVSGIPQTVIIGKDGTVQAVHVGFSDDIAEELRTQIQALVDGKTLAEPNAENAAAPAAPVAAGGTATLEEQWSVRGSWSGVAADPSSGDAYSLRGGTRLVRFDRAGQELDSVRFDIQPFDAGDLRLGNLVGDAAPEFLVFRTWGDRVRTFDAKGKLLWEYIGESGIDDACIADLDPAADNTPGEVIIGYNGGAGLHALNADGSLRWKYTRIGNVWHVTAGPTGEGGAAEVITTSAEGVVHVFSAAGKKAKDLRPPGYANLVRLGRAEPGGPLIIVTTLDNGANLSAMTRDGKRLWKAPLARGDRHVTGGECSPASPWLALTTSSTVSLIDLRTGAIAATIRPGRSPTVAWTTPTADHPPLLVVASASGLRAYRVVESDAEGAPAEGANPEP